MLTIYTPMAGGLAKEALDGVALMLGTSNWQSAISIGMTLGVCGMAWQYITGNKMKSVARFAVMSFAILYILLGLKFPVAIIDMQQPMKAHEVDGVPAGLALPAAFVSQIGRALSKTFDDALHMPNQKGYNETGMIFGSRIALASSAADFGATPQLSADLSNYMRQCVWIAKVQVARDMTVSQIVSSTSLMTTLFAKPSPVYHVILGKEDNLSCLKAAPILQHKLLDAANKESQRFANSFTHGDKVKFDAGLSDAQSMFVHSSQTGTDLLIQNMLMNKVHNSVEDAMAFTGSTAGMMNYANTSSMNNLRIAEANTFWMAGYRLPMLNATLWILLMCLFPIIILLGFSPIFHNAYKSFIMTMVWLWTWPPMFTALNFFISYYASTKTTIFGTQSGGITMSNVHSLNMIHSDMAFTAGFLAMAIPFIAKGITTGLDAAFTNAAQYLGSMTHGVSSSIASSISQGNVSVDNFSGMNANYDNIGAHKHDINQTDYRGMSTHQLASGATVTQTASGFGVINTQPGMSHMAVGIQGSQAIVNSLTHNAQTAQHRGDSFRTAADHSLQSALRSTDSFSRNDANDYRSGAGVSHSTDDSQTRDVRNMNEALHGFNAGRGANHQITSDQAASLSFDSGGQLIGKAVQLGSGLSMGAKGTLGHLHQQNTDLKEFADSKYGKTYSDSLGHLVRTSQNEHLDSSSSHSLSKGQQIGADFAKAVNFSHQASAEFSTSENYSKAASIASSESQSINSNLNNAFETWAIQKYGDTAMGTLSGTDAGSIAKTTQWGEEFLQSSAGQSALSQQTNSLMADVKSGSSFGSYQQHADALGSNTNIAGSNASNQQQVHAMGGQVQTLNKKQLSDAHALMARQNNSELMKQASVNKAHVASGIQNTRDSISQDGAITKGKVDGEFKHGVVMGDLHAVAHDAEKAAEGPKPTTEESHMFDKFRK